MASLTSSTKIRHSFGSAMPSPVWSMSRYTASGGVEQPALRPDGADGPEVGQRVRGRARAAHAGDAEAALDGHRRLRAGLVRADCGRGGRASAAHDQIRRSGTSSSPLSCVFTAAP